MRYLKKPLFSLLAPSFLLLLFLVPSPAFGATEALSPWFHLASVSRPGNLRAGQAKDEVQRLTVNATKGGYALVNAKAHSDGEYVNQILAYVIEHRITLAQVTTAAVLPFDASAAEVQKALEHILPGRSVNVTALPGGVEEHSYEIVFPGQSVEPAFAEVNGLDAFLGAATLELPETEPNPVTEPGVKEKHDGSATSSQLQEGKSDREIVLTAVNVGDGDANAVANPVSVTDKLPPHLKALSAEVVIATNYNDAGVRTGPGQCAVETAREVQCTWAGTFEREKGENGKAKFEVVPKILPPFDQIEVVVGVAVEPGASSGEVNEASVSGGGAPPAHARHAITVSESPTSFGVEDYELTPEEAGGAVDAQAGSHPFQLTTTFDLNQTLNQAGKPVPAALAKDLSFKLPAGLIGNPSPFTKCTLGQFSTTATTSSLANLCPGSSVVGVATVTVNEPTIGGESELVTLTEPVFNLEPSVGEPARFGFMVAHAPVLLETSVRTGEDYGVTVHTENIPQSAGFLENTVTFWGVPGDARHNAIRGWGCLEEANENPNQFYPCEAEHETQPPLLALPTSCTGELQTSVQADSWIEPSRSLSYEPRQLGSSMPAMDGCGLLPFASEIKASPDVQAASTPSGLTTDVHVPQEEALNATGLAPADLKNITVALPAGVRLNPSASDGLEACSSAPGDLTDGQLGSPGDQIGFGVLGAGGLTEFTEYVPGVRTPRFTPYLPGGIAAKGAAEGHEIPESEATLQPGVNFCANASKIAEVTIKLPILPHGQYLHGFVYLAAQEANPFGSLMALYLVAEDPVSGIALKLPGEVQLCKGAGEVIDGMACEALGQIVTTFQDSPQGPLEDAEFHFFGGERAPLATPTRCGAYTTRASFEPWTNTESSHEDLHSSSTFDITSGPNHTPCPGASLPFSPTLTGGALNVNAGAFSPFDATMSRLSGEQNLQSLEVHLPPGLSGILANVELCAEPQANLGECGPNSLIGETTVSVGVGGEPYTVSGGKFYLTGPYNGVGACKVGEAGCAPFGITFTVPAKAGPFDLAKTAHNHPPCDCVLVRGKIEINPLTAVVTIASNPPGTPDSIPTSLEGIPLEIEHVNAITTRANFQFNPTNCSKMEVTGTIHSSVGGTDTIGVPFQVTNCKNLEFTPKFQVSTSGKTSKQNGASLTTKVTEPAGSLGTQTNIAKVKVELPEQLPSRLTTLQKACTAAQFEANPAGCPAPSVIGHATVHTPLIPVPLEGPVYFVSHGGEAFPSLEIVLQGYGVKVILVGATFISKSGITSTTFKTVPDQPFSSFELTLPEGKYSALAANGNLCNSKLAMPNEFIAQNGAEIHEDTTISVTGCAPAIYVVKHGVKGRTATIRVSVPSAGKLVATGKGLSKASKTANGATTLTLKLPLTNAEAAFLGKHKTRKLEVKVNLTFTPKKGGKLKTTTTVLIG
jgi:hypothetical protein